MYYSRFCSLFLSSSSFFFFNDPPPTEIYTLSLHDALPISSYSSSSPNAGSGCTSGRVTPLSSSGRPLLRRADADRKSTRLNSSHSQISYAVFCLKKKKKKKKNKNVYKKKIHKS